MTEVPKIVHQRLRVVRPEQSALAQAHPEADLLTAFAEQTLSVAERNGILEHLALCADCRELVVLALPAAEAVTAPVEVESAVAGVPARETRAGWFASVQWGRLGWGQLRWAALAAGIAMAVLIVRPALWHTGNPSSVANKLGAPAAPVANAPAPVASAEVVESSGVAKAAGPNAGTSDHPVEMAAAGAKTPRPATLGQHGRLVGNLEKKESYAGTTPGMIAGLKAPATANERVDAAPAGTAMLNPQMGNNLAAQDSLAITRAKPALDADAKEAVKAGTGGGVGQGMAPMAGKAFVLNGATSQTAVLQQTATWTITAGLLQRSLDAGQSWQTSLRADHALLCYANRGQDIWAGGQAGTLMHSSDDGATWSTVTVSSGSQTLNSDVTRIDLRGREIVLTTGNLETWHSDDAGKTWKK
jgi:hypothetical protein